LALNTMDDFGGNAGESAEEDDGSGLVVAAIHTIGGFLFFYLLRRCCKRCCCRREEPETGAAGAVATAEPCQMQPRKRLISCYILLFCGGIVGAHHFYLERLCHGLIAVWTGNFFLFGWLLDAILMPSYLRSYNSRRADPEVSLDTSARRLLIRLPCLFFGVLGTLVGVALYLPAALHYTGVVDIDRLAAQTERNPYDVLEIKQAATLQEAKSAYRKLSLKWHPDRNHGCGKKCDDMMSEITKAFELIKKRRAPVREDLTWKDWLQAKGEDWWFVLEIWSKKDDTADQGSSKTSKESEL